jgi:hypothetical protein
MPYHPFANARQLPMYNLRYYRDIVFQLVTILKRRQNYIIFLNSLSLGMGCDAKYGIVHMDKSI